MKRTYPANIDGQIFHIDEDAFALLKNYLEQLKQTFTGIEGQEIVADIESRIREHFACRIDSGANVIVFSDVNDVIATMGRPEQLREEPQDYSREEDTAGTATEKETSGEENDMRTSRPFISINLPSRKSLYRNMQDKVFGGVFGGLALYLGGWNANIMRLLFAIITCFSYFWPLTIIYLIAWMIIPPALTPRQILKMKGTPMNVDTVGRAVVETAVTPPPYNDSRNESGFFPTIFSIAGKCLMGLFAIVAGSVAFVSIVATMVIGVGSIALAGFANASILKGFDLGPEYIGWSGIGAILCGITFIAVVSSALVWGACSVIFHLRSMTLKTIITLIIISTMLLIATIVFFAISNSSF